MRVHAKFRADRSKFCGDVYGRFSIFLDGVSPPFRIYCTCFWTTHEEYTRNIFGLFHSEKFGWNRCSI